MRRKPSNGLPVKQKDLYWDQIVLVLILANLGLSFLVMLIQFFRKSEVQCDFELDNFTISNRNYINSYCFGSLLNAPYYLVFILVPPLVIIAPHYLWNDYFASHFDFCYLIKNFDCVRDINTGEYDPQSFEHVKNLEEKYSKSRKIFCFYKLKLVLQLTVTCVALILNTTYFRMEGFDEKFRCPKNCVVAGSNSTNPAKLNCPVHWPLNKQVMCVYDLLRLLRFLYYAQYVFLGLAILVFITSLVWTYSPHATELGAKKIGKFCFASCLDPEAFSFASWKVLTRYSCGRQRLKLSRIRHSSCEKSPRNFCKFFFSLPCFNPCIENDLDFLLMRLFVADSGFGQVFKDIQILRYLRMKVLVDHERLYRFNKMCEYWLEMKITGESPW